MVMTLEYWDLTLVIACMHMQMLYMGYTLCVHKCPCIYVVFPCKACVWPWSSDLVDSLLVSVCWSMELTTSFIFVLKALRLARSSEKHEHCPILKSSLSYLRDAEFVRTSFVLFHVLFQLPHFVSHSVCSLYCTWQLHVHIITYIVIVHTVTVHTGTLHGCGILEQGYY